MCCAMKRGHDLNSEHLKGSYYQSANQMTKEADDLQTWSSFLMQPGPEESNNKDFYPSLLIVE